MKAFLKTFGVHKVSAILVLGYIGFVSIYMLSHRIWFSPDQFFVFGLFGTVFIGRARTFFKDWLPFILFFLGYEFLRGLIPYVTKNVHILPMINIDMSIFGFIPTIKLQTLLYNPTHLMWYDYIAVAFYISHFVMPMLVGYYFWLKDRVFFKKFALGILVVSYAAFVTYIIFPAMPPWMASNFGYIPPVKEVTGVVMAHFFQTSINLPSIYTLIGGNPVAAMPSLHAALPLMIFFFLVKWNKKASVFFLPYVLGVWFSVIYLGEHYFIDVMMGAIYSTVIFLLLDSKYLKSVTWFA
jgi:hypothetical protein